VSPSISRVSTKEAMQTAAVCTIILQVIHNKIICNPDNISGRPGIHRRFLIVIFASSSQLAEEWQT